LPAILKRAISTGAAAAMRGAPGVAVFSGMIGVTAFGRFLTPVFYVVLMKLGRKKSTTPQAVQPTSPGGRIPMEVGRK
jgi:multidrug efflux pump